MAKNKTSKEAEAAVVVKPAKVEKAADAPGAARPPTAKRIVSSVGLTYTPPLKPAQIARLRRGLPGYANLLDDVAELVAEDAEALNLGGVAEQMLEVHGQQKFVVARETVLASAHLSIYHQRLSLDDAGMGLLRQVARRVNARSEEDPSLLDRYNSLLSFLAKFSGGGTRAAAAEEPPPAEPDLGPQPTDLKRKKK